MCLILAGLTELRHRLFMSCHESLSRRLVMRHYITGLERDELDAYLTHRLRLADCELPLFELPTVEILFHGARGLAATDQPDRPLRAVRRRPRQGLNRQRPPSPARPRRAPAMTCPIDWPDEINDETVATMVDFFYALGDAVANRYCAQISRYYDDQRSYPIPLDTHDRSVRASREARKADDSVEVSAQRPRRLPTSKVPQFDCVSTRTRLGFLLCSGTVEATRRRPTPDAGRGAEFSGACVRGTRRGDGRSVQVRRPRHRAVPASRRLPRLLALCPEVRLPRNLARGERGLEGGCLPHRARGGERRATMKTIRKFDALGERYQFDARLCRAGAGWAQVDTTQDASYFGTWTNPSTRQILEFCEGDITLRTAEADDEYVAAVRELHAWNLERRYWKGIDPGFDEALRGEFHRLGLADLLH